MSSTYKTPGVYIEEISKFPPSIAEVATAIPAFIGYTQKAIFQGVDYHQLAEDTATAAEAANRVANATDIASEADKVAGEAEQATNEAKQAADEAEQAANEAKQAANEAKKATDEAKQAADEANKAANEANKAPNDADKAKAAADKAKAAADKAKVAADKAKAAADKAKVAADKAKVAADKAKVAADKAIAKDAAQEVKKAADQKQSEDDKKTAATAAAYKATADNAKVAQPLRITSLLEYELYFGTTKPETGIVVKIEETLAQNIAIERKISAKNDNRSKHNMYYAMQAYFANGGGPCYIVSVGKIKDYDDVSLKNLQSGIEKVEKVDEMTLFVFPESQALNLNQRAALFDTAIQQCLKLQDRFAIFDLQQPTNGQTILDAAKDFRDLSLNPDALKYSAIYTPNIETIFNYQYDNALEQVKIVYLQNGQPVLQKDDKGKNVDKYPNLASLDPNQKDGNAILFNLAKAAINDIPVILPPSPLVAGQYAFVDSTRGVFKAPANVTLSSVIKPTITITNAQQEDLNVHTTGKSINAIRAFTGKGTLIWGARTLDGNSNEWRYVPVRRFFNMAEESIKKATEGFVFEPNDANTWVKVKAMIENFLILQWRAGALAGAKPEQAFYVKVGLNETMTALDILEGRMIIEIGMAVVRPAEFIILKFSHKMQES
ncbi:phage tail sheath C-terminal domain-containing protein [Aetokthonos hydrillicola]|uniref:phage tail sheath C-terminal domain-containing protein n=1 Tax=Aetokthonos hydrillicola TaxID=1550245 RepID=UPI001ABB0727|nr:phage tail sheath C-terminal domain-containing protein [Aetokthonos hydrillicola]